MAEVHYYILSFFCEMKRRSQNHNFTDQCLSFKHRRSAIKHKDGFHMIKQQFTDTTKHSNEMGIRQRVAMTIT